MTDDDKPFKLDTDGSVGFKVFSALFNMFDKPATFIREKIVEPARGGKKEVYYHRRFNRVPTIDECYVDDYLCKHEANSQYKRDRFVDRQILRILNTRRVECYEYYRHDMVSMCKQVEKDYEEAADNFYIKYGDQPINHDVTDAYMKQKHRLIWERRQKEKGELK